MRLQLTSHALQAHSRDPGSLLYTLEKVIPIEMAATRRFAGKDERGGGGGKASRSVGSLEGWLGGAAPWRAGGCGDQSNPS